VEALDFNAESRKKKLTRKLDISCLVQKIFTALQITRNRIKKEEIDKKASEKASHPS
jgi:cytidylate kinase